MAFVRKNQSTLTVAEWTAFITAVNNMHGTSAPTPAYRDFVSVHVDAMSGVGMSWSIHSMQGMPPGRNFLAWHRQLLVKMEQMLGVAIPYWDWIATPSLPPQLSTPALLLSWSVTRNLTPSQMSIVPGALTNAVAQTTFGAFQSALEGGAHNAVHRAVGGMTAPFGDMATTHSPADPIFWLHHANVDRVWARWQTAHNNAAGKPTNGTEILQPNPSPIFQGKRVSQVLKITTLGYRYA